MDDKADSSRLHQLVRLHGRERARDMVPTKQRALIDIAAENQLPKVVQGVTFTNGVEVINTPAQDAA